MIIKKGIKGKNKGGILSILSICMSVLVLSLGSLYFATDKFGIEMFYSYFRNPYTILLNTIPILLLIVFLFLVCNRLWISIGITSIVVIVLTLINYFKILFRDDPLMVEDLSLFLEMKNMTGRYKIHANSTMAFWILSMVILVGIVWKIRKVVEIRMKLRTRIIFLIITALSGIFCMHSLVLNDKYYQKTENIALINQWRATQQFVSRGFVYPFLYSSKEAKMEKPSGYSKKEIENSLKDIKEDDYNGLIN